MAAFRKLVIGSKALAFITLVSGAFVAGLDAGLVYNSFPKFADRWIPEDILAFSPTLRNITENPTTMQFNHRILGTSTLAALLLTAARAQSLPLPLISGSLHWPLVAWDAFRWRWVSPLSCSMFRFLWLQLINLELWQPSHWQCGWLTR